MQAEQFTDSSQAQPPVWIITQVDGDEADPSLSQVVKSLGGGPDEWGMWPGTSTAAV